MKNRTRKANTIIAVMLALAVSIGSAAPTFAASSKPSYYPYKSAAAKKHATEMAFKNLEKNSAKKSTKKAATSKTKKTTSAKKSSKTTSKKVTTKKSDTRTKEKYLNVNEAYNLLNKFRTTKSNQWYWSPNNKTKTYTYGLKPLKRDAQLEKIAKQRAKEQWASGNVYNRPTHTRPNGKDCSTAYPASARFYGENLGWGQTSCKQMITDPKWGWAETNEKYSGQGHRRIMLSKSAKRVGIACYEKDGKTCWAMCVGY